jgi:uncharacterized cupredoxin-like copper-binding protein
MAGAALTALLLVVAYTVASAPFTVRLSVARTAFSTDRITVPVGRPITFELDNRDFIDHEWIVGSEAIHAAHRTGSEPVHGSRPSEVTIPAHEIRTTTITFTEPGTVRYICHLPGHEAYGMTGIVVVG